MLRAGELDLVSLLAVIDECFVEVGVLHDLFHLLFAQRLGVFLPLPRLDLPSRLAIVGVDAGHALEYELLPKLVRTPALLYNPRFEAAAEDDLARAPQRRHGLDLVHSADVREVFGDDLVGGLGLQRCREDRQPGQRQEGLPHGLLPRRG